MISINMVREAMNSLKKAGKPTSVPRIREIIGSGSFATIQKFKKEIDAQQSLLESVNQIPRSDFEILRLDVNNLHKIVNSLRTDIERVKKNTVLGNKIIQCDEKLDNLDDNHDNHDNHDDLADIRELWLEANENWFKFRNKFHNQRERNKLDNSGWEKMYNASEAKLKKVQSGMNVEELENNLSVQHSQNATLKIKNKDLESRLNNIQVDAQKTIDELTQKLNDAKDEITRQAKEYSDLQAKFSVLKAKINSPVTEKIKRDPVVLDSKASQIDDDFILGSTKAKTRAKALAKQGFNGIDIATRLVSEGYRKKGITGDFKAYTSKEITKWLK